MVRTNLLSPQAEPKPTILVEPESEGPDGRTRFKVAVARGRMHSDERVFDSLADALAYARSLYVEDEEGAHCNA